MERATADPDIAPGADREAVEGADTVLGGTKPGDEELTPDDLPGDLGPHADELNDAIASSTVPTKFPEKDDYPPPAFQPEAIAGVVVPVLHPHLEDAAIAFRYRKTLRQNKEPVGAKSYKVGLKWRTLSGFDFVLEFNYERWVDLSRVERVRLVDHELCHCGEDDEGEFTDAPHDIEEFVPILRRWGVGRGQKWAAEAIQQADLFEQ